MKHLLFRCEFSSPSQLQGIYPCPREIFPLPTKNLMRSSKLSRLPVALRTTPAGCGTQGVFSPIHQELSPQLDPGSPVRQVRSPLAGSISLLQSYGPAGTDRVSHHSHRNHENRRMPFCQALCPNTRCYSELMPRYLPVRPGAPRRNGARVRMTRVAGRSKPHCHCEPHLVVRSNARLAAPVIIAQLAGAF